MNITRLNAPLFTTRPRAVTPRLWLIHATRGAGTQASQGAATVDWFTRSTPDLGGWGPTADALIDHLGNVYEFRDIPRECSAYSAGYGMYGPPSEVAADDHAISVELAQSANLEPYAPATITALVEYVKQRTKDWNLTIPPVHLASWNQRASEPIPTGFIGHDETANGRKGGKTDPGALFPWADVMARLAAPVLMSDDMLLNAMVSARYLGGGYYNGVRADRPRLVRTEQGVGVYEWRVQ